MLDAILNLNLPRELIVILVGMTPIFELRLALPVAINIFGYPWHYALLLSVLGNMLPVPFLLLFWNPLSRFLRRFGIFRGSLDWLAARTERRSGTIAKYGFWGLLVFVAVPIPLTGAWTASLVAVLLGMKFWPSFWSIFGGVVVAGVVVTAFSLMGWLGAGIAIVGFAALTIWGIWRSKNHTGAPSVPEKVKP